MNRSAVIDKLRGVAIFLMVWGHMLQRSHSDEFLCFSDPVFLLIYSFHMPLLILISGYLFGLKDPPKNIFMHRIFPLLRVIFVWNILDYSLRYGFAKFLKMDAVFSIQNMLNSLLGLWFLWAVLAYDLIGWLAWHLNGILRHTVILFGWILLYLFPSTQNLLFLYPLFWIGVFAAHNRDRLCHLAAHRAALPTAFLIYGVSMQFFQADFLVYFTGVDGVSSGLSPFRQLGIDLFRLWVGIWGSIVVLLICLRLSKYSLRFLEQLGRESLWIYVVQRTTVEYFYSVSYSLLCRAYLGFNPLLSSKPVYWFGSLVLTAAGLWFILYLRRLLHKVPLLESILVY